MVGVDGGGGLDGVEGGRGEFISDPSQGPPIGRLGNCAFRIAASLDLDGSRWVFFFFLMGGWGVGWGTLVCDFD